MERKAIERLAIDKALGELDADTVALLANLPARTKHMNYVMNKNGLLVRVCTKQ